MRVRETLEINIPDDELNVDIVEQYLIKALEGFKKRVFRAALAKIEESP